MGSVTIAFNAYLSNSSIHAIAQALLWASVGCVLLFRRLLWTNPEATGASRGGIAQWVLGLAVACVCAGGGVALAGINGEALRFSTLCRVVSIGLGLSGLAVNVFALRHPSWLSQTYFTLHGMRTCSCMLLAEPLTTPCTGLSVGAALLVFAARGYSWDMRVGTATAPAAIFRCAASAA